MYRTNIPIALSTPCTYTLPGSYTVSGTLRALYDLVDAPNSVLQFSGSPRQQQVFARCKSRSSTRLCFLSAAAPKICCPDSEISRGLCPSSVMLRSKQSMVGHTHQPPVTFKVGRHITRRSCYQSPGRSHSKRITLVLPLTSASHAAVLCGVADSGGQSRRFEHRDAPRANRGDH